jgi:hypothetical protein
MCLHSSEPVPLCKGSLSLIRTVFTEIGWVVRRDAKDFPAVWHWRDFPYGVHHIFEVLDILFESKIRRKRKPLDISLKTRGKSTQ